MLNFLIVFLFQDSGLHFLIRFSLWEAPISTFLRFSFPGTPGEPFFDLKLGRGMAISLSLKEEHNNRKMELTISLFLTED